MSDERPQTEVDRLLGKVKNNRIAAVVIVACIGLVGASAVYKALVDVFPRLGGSSGWSGSYSAQWNGTTRFISPAAWPPAPNTEHGTLTLTEAGDGVIVVSFQVLGNPPMGAAALKVEGGAASWLEASPLNVAFVGTTSNGADVTVVADAISATLSGDNLTVTVLGHNSGKINGVPWKGTYSGAWVGHRVK